MMVSSPARYLSRQRRSIFGIICVLRPGHEEEENPMQADDILVQVKSNDEPPHGWIVLPLVRRQVITGIAGWIFGIFMGLGLFVAIAFTVIPYNYQHGTAAAIFTSLLLAILRCI